MDNADPFSSIEDSRALAQAIVDTVREPWWCSTGISASSRRAARSTRPSVSRQDTQGRPIYALGNGQWDIPALRLLLEKILPQHAVIEAYEIEHEFPGIGRRTMLLNARQVFDEDNADTH